MLNKSSATLIIFIILSCFLNRYIINVTPEPDQSFYFINSKSFFRYLSVIFVQIMSVITPGSLEVYSLSCFVYIKTIYTSISEVLQTYENDTLFKGCQLKTCQIFSKIFKEKLTSIPLNSTSCYASQASSYSL